MKSKTSTASENQEAFLRLSDILDTLRKECPWDKVQTMKSLRYLTIEEVHELSEAIVALKDPDDSKIQNLKKELGDLAMHILFYCKIAEDEGLFTTADVYNTICDKLIARHPFIYDKENYHGENWEQLKMREGRKNVLEGVPDTLPTLINTVRMQEKVAGETKNTSELIDKHDSSSSLHAPSPLRGTPPNLGGEQLPHPVPTNSPSKLEGMAAKRTGAYVAEVEECTKHITDEEEFGDLLFDLVDWGRRHGINADDALALANRRFKKQHSC